MRTLLYASLLLGSAAPLAAQAYRVGSPFQPRITIGRVSGMVTSPDGLWTVYVGDQRKPGVYEIDSVRSDGSGTALRLNDALVLNGDVQLGSGERIGVQVTADSSRVVYRADAAVDEQYELYSALIDGHGAPRRMNLALEPGETVFETVLLAPGAGSGQCVFGVGTGSAPTELYVAPADGSSSARRIDAGSGDRIDQFAVSKDGTRFLYIDYSSILFAGPLDGSSAPVSIASGATTARFSPDGNTIVFRQFTYPPSAFWLASAPSTGGPTTVLAANPFDFEIAANSIHVIFRNGGETNAHLSCVPISGGAVQLLSSYPSGHVLDYSLTPDGHVVFLGTQPEGQGLYLAAFPSGSAHRISLDLAPSAYVYDFRLSPDGTSALYSAGTYTTRTLYSVMADGVHALADEVDDDYRFTPDGTSAIYRAGAALSLYRRALDGATPAVRLDDSQPPVPTLSFELDASGQRILYRRETNAPASSPIDLFSVRPDGTETRQLNLPLPTVSTGGVARFHATHDGERCVYLADAEQDEVVELWSSSTRRGSASVRLNGTLQLGGDVQSDFTLTGDDSRVVYRVDGDVDERFDLFTSSLSGLEPPVALTSAFASDLNVAAGLLVDPSGQCVVFRASRASGPLDLYVAPLSGASPPAPRNDGTDSGVVAPVRLAGGYIFYLGRRPSSGRCDLLRVPLDGSSGPVRLNDPPVFGGGIAAGGSSFLLTPDGARAVYLTAQTDFIRFDLYSVPVDRSSSPVRLSGSLSSNTIITSFQLSADGSYVLYETVTSGYSGYSDYRLYGVPVDRSLAPVELVRNPTQPTQAIPTGHVAVVRREDSLAVVPVDGSAPALALTPSLPNLREFVLSPDGEFVVYARGYPYSGISELDRVPTAGGSLPEPVLGPLPGYHQVLGDFSITPDSRRIVFKGVLGPQVGLFSRRLGEVGTGAWLASDVHMLADPLSFEVTADSRRVLFLHGTSFQTYELFASELAQPRQAQSPGPR